MTEVAEKPDERRGWLEVAEAGSLFGIRFVVFLCTAFGRPVARSFVAVLAFYFTASRSDVRRTARAYRRRMGLGVGFWDVWRQVRAFADVAMDRLFFMKGEYDHYELSHNGYPHLVKLKEEKRGAILLGAHLGSFEAMRMRSDAQDLPVNVVGYFKNTARINGVLAKFNPRVHTRLIEVEPDSPGFIFKVQECIEAGEMVAILGDRAGYGAKTSVDFLGGKVEFPTGPYVIAAVLNCPIYLTFGLYHPPNRYDLYCEPFAERIVLPRKDRDAELQKWAQKYAERLEHYCRLAPDNWFNFFDVWHDDDERQS